MPSSIVVCPEICPVQRVFYGSLADCFSHGQYRTHFAASLDMASTTSLTLALSLWLCLFGNGDSAAWEEPAFVRMSGVPWFRSYCHLPLFRRGGGGLVEWKCFTQLLSIPSLCPFSLGSAGKGKCLV